MLKRMLKNVERMLKNVEEVCVSLCFPFRFVLRESRCASASPRRKLHKAPWLPRCGDRLRDHVLWDFL